MNDLLASLSLNNLFRYFLPGALLVLYLNQVYSFLNQIFCKYSSDIIFWTGFLVISLGVGALLYLFYRGVLHPYWWLIQHWWRTIPTYSLFTKICKDLEIPIGIFSRKESIINSQVCLGNFFAKRKFKNWNDDNEFRISPIHLYYLLAIVSFLIAVHDCIICLLQCCSGSDLIPVFTFSNRIVLIISSFAFVIIGEYYDRIADTYEGQFLLQHIDDYKKHIKNIFSNDYDAIKILHLKRN